MERGAWQATVPRVAESRVRLLALGVQSLNHWRIHFYLLLGMKAECPAQKELQRQETPDFQEREGHQGKRDVAPRPRGRPFSKHKRTPHTVSICTYILGNSSFDHTSHINLREDNIQALRWIRPKTSLRIASVIKLSCSDWNTMEKGLAEVKKKIFN